MNTKLQSMGNLVGHAVPGIPRAIEVDGSSRLGAPAVQVTFPTKELENLLQFLKRSSLVQAKALLDLWVVDYPGRARRFEVKYNLLSFRFQMRVLLRSCLAENKALGTAERIYKSAGWLEREAFDLYGVFFMGNGDLRRLLTDYGFVGYPMRKDFPLSGYLEVRYDDN